MGEQLPGSRPQSKTSGIPRSMKSGRSHKCANRSARGGQEHLDLVARGDDIARHLKNGVEMSTDTAQGDSGLKDRNNAQAAGGVGRPTGDAKRAAAGDGQATEG